MSEYTHSFEHAVINIWVVIKSAKQAAMNYSQSLRIVLGITSTTATIIQANRCHMIGVTADFDYIFFLREEMIRLTYML